MTVTCTHGHRHASLVQSVRCEEEAATRWIRRHDEHGLTFVDGGVACACGDFLTEFTDQG